MKTYILKLRDKPESYRKRVFIIALIVSMSLVFGIWAYSLSHRFKPEVVKKETREDIKPFKLLGVRFKGTFQNISASVNNAKLKKDESKQEVQIEQTEIQEKVVDLIPIN